MGIAVTFGTRADVRGTEMRSRKRILGMRNVMLVKILELI